MAIVKVINLCWFTATKIIQINQKLMNLNYDLSMFTLPQSLDCYFISKVNLTLIYNWDKKKTMLTHYTVI